MKTVDNKKTDSNVIAIVKAGDWWKKDALKKQPFWITEDNYAVVRYMEYDNSPNEPAIEGKTTVAICRELKDAKILFKALDA